MPRFWFEGPHQVRLEFGGRLIFSRMQITALGDSALIVRVRDQFEDAPEETLNEVSVHFTCFAMLEFPALLTSRRLIPASQFSLIRSSSRK